MMTDNGRLRWYVTRAERGDVLAGHILSQFKTEFYYPCESRLVAAPKRTLPPSRRAAPPLIERRAPLFKNYFFVHVDLWDGSWPRIRGAAGLKWVLGLSADKPLDAGAAVAELKAREVDGAIPGKTPALALREAVTLASREAVTISGGSFAGQDAIVDPDRNALLENLDAAAKVWLLVAMLGCKAPVETPLVWIERRRPAA